MKGRGVGAALAAAAVLASLGPATSPTGRLMSEATNPAPAPTRSALPGSFHDIMLRAATIRAAAGRNPNRRGRWPGLGWSVAQDRRNARKRRNVLRNRRK